MSSARQLPPLPPARQAQLDGFVEKLDAWRAGKVATYGSDAAAAAKADAKHGTKEAYFAHLDKMVAKKVAATEAKLRGGDAESLAAQAMRAIAARSGGGAGSLGGAPATLEPYTGPSTVNEGGMFRGYGYTGPLVAYEVVNKLRGSALPASIARPDYAISSIPASEDAERRSKKIEVKSAADIVALRRVCALGREVLDRAGRIVAVGNTPEQVDQCVMEACAELECYPSPLNYRGFPKAVCTSVNEVICHGIPDTRPFVDGDIVNLDITVYKEGFHADLNETFWVGAVDDESKALTKCAYACLAAGIATVKPGALYRDIGNAISKVAAKAKLSVVRSYCGHGIGKLFHTAPNVPHYRKNKAVGVIRPGHVFTIEPMINVGNWRDDSWPDDWTAVTSDGTRSAQFEHTMVVTETGVEILTARRGAPSEKIVWDEAAIQR